MLMNILMNLKEIIFLPDLKTLLYTQSNNVYVYHNITRFSSLCINLTNAKCDIRICDSTVTHCSVAIRLKVNSNVKVHGLMVEVFDPSWNAGHVDILWERTGHACKSH